MLPFDFLIILAACRSMRYTNCNHLARRHRSRLRIAQYAAIECRKRKGVDEDQKQKVKVKGKGKGPMTCNVTPLPLPSTDAV